jgi:hypothetical protein
MLPPGNWEVKDPTGHKHYVTQQHQVFSGHENLTHCIEMVQRPYVLSSLFHHIEQQPDMGEWEGYVWMRR